MTGGALQTRQLGRRRRKGGIEFPGGAGVVQSCGTVSALLGETGPFHGNNGAPAPQVFSPDEFPAGQRLQRRRRTVPVAVRRPEVEQRLQDPGRARPRLLRTRCNCKRLFAVAGPIGLRHQAPQTQQAGFRFVHHCLEKSLGRAVVAVELRRLGGKQQGQRRPVEQPVGLAGPAFGFVGGAGRDGHHAEAQCPVSPLAPPPGPPEAHRLRRAAEREPEPVCESSQQAEKEERHQNRSCPGLNDQSEFLEPKRSVARHLRQQDGRSHDEPDLEQRP